MQKLISSVALIGSLGILSACMHGPRTPAQVLNEAKYLELRPPSTLYYPASINRIENQTDRDIDLNPTCTLSEEKLKGYYKPSDTADREMVDKLAGSFSLSGSYLDVIKAKVGGNAVKDVKVTFKNAEILVSSTQQMLSLIDSVDDECSRAILSDLQSGVPVCQIRAIYRADVSYVINYDSKIEAEVKAQLTEAIAPTLAANATRNGVDRIEGKRLHYGVKIGPQCLTSPDGKEILFRMPGAKGV